LLKNALEELLNAVVGLPVVVDEDVLISSSPAASPRILKKDGSLGFFGFFWSVFASFL
jgi:hypothetical protein